MLSKYIKSYFAGENEIIPILNTDNLLKVCKIIQEDTDGYIFAKDKIYKCTASSNYKLEANLVLNDADYIDKYPELFGEKSWIETTETEVTKTLTNQVTNFGTVGSSTYEAPATEHIHFKYGVHKVVRITQHIMVEKVDTLSEQ